MTHRTPPSCVEPKRLRKTTQFDSVALVPEGKKAVLLTNLISNTYRILAHRNRKLAIRETQHYNGPCADRTIVAHHPRRKPDQGLQSGPRSGSCRARCLPEGGSRGVRGHRGTLRLGQVHAFLPAGRADPGHLGPGGDRWRGLCHTE